MQKQSFNQSWRFYLGQPTERMWREADDSNWRLLDLPHDWSIELPRDAGQPSSSSGGYFPMGCGWYRKTFTPPEEWKGKKVFIEFEGIYMNASVWLNRDLLGFHPYGYTTFHYDLTPYLKWGEPNLLKVFVDNTHQLNSRWYSGSGIYRPVWLLVADPVHLAHWGVYVTTPQVSAQAAAVRARTQVENESETVQEVQLRTRILAPDGSIVATAESSAVITSGGEYEFVQEMTVAAPKLWSPDTPHLYRLESEVLAAGKVVDSETTTFGIRSLSFSAEQGFLLNGQPLKLKGGCVHHDNGILGAASYARSEERKVEIHKASGYNAIRTAHNPPAPAFLEACDRLGMLVMDEAFDCWREGKNIGDYHVAFEDWWQRDIASMVLRDRNHPSVILWSIGNEVLERDGRSNGAEVARMLAEAVRSLDPTRPVTSAICGTWDGGDWELTDAVFAQLDVGGYNYQWMQYQPDHERHPERIMVGTESFPIQAFDNWMSVLENPYVIGDFVWTSLDYLGEAGIGRVHFDPELTEFLGRYPWHQANCGDLDLCGFKRPQSYYRDMLWQDQARLYIAVHAPLPEGVTENITLWGWHDVWHSWTWKGHEGQVLKVDVYSSCDEVELFLNGKSLGVQPTTRQERHIAAFEVPYEPGELKAVGYRRDAAGAVKESVAYSLKTAGEPVQIRLTPDRATIPADLGSLCYVTVEVLDAAGQVHPGAENLIFFTVKGAGGIAAVGNSNPVSTEMYVGNQRRAFRGRCLVVVKANGQPGEIRLRAQADGLEGDEVVITTA